MVLSDSHTLQKTYTATDIQTWLIAQVCEQVGIEPEEIDIQESLESYGLDSAQAMTIVSKAEHFLGFSLSPVWLWHYPTIATLSQRLAEEFTLESQAKQESFAVDTIPKLDLSAEAVLDATISPEDAFLDAVDEPESVFLTGGTGFLGAFLIQELLQKTAADVYCLVRAAHPEEGKKRLQQNLERYNLWQDELSDRIIPVLGDLSQPLLGLSSAQFQMLAGNIDAIYHSAALLNYVYPYSALKAANVLGTQEILRLACQFKVKPVHYVSSVAIFESANYAGKVVKEQDEFDHWAGIYLGYSQTKWVAEKLVKIARDRGLPVTIYRPPLIAGHSKTGVSNVDDFICLMLKGCIQLGSFPDIDYMLDMSPVDYVSQAIVYLSQQKESIGKAFHLQHPQPIHIREFFEWVKSLNHSIQPMPYEQWQAEVLNSVCSVDNPLYTLRPFLLEKWSDEQLTIPELYMQARRPQISCEQTVEALAHSDISCPSIDAQLFGKYLSNLIDNGFLQVA
ncbi:thioester reductase domain protein [Gloeocapsa sp. PCC 7428]|uniref:thioester reductase domain-containing protein n=1 Tax=Gloeocapsa sp. PCC 7428 TaxID=1173026 RepID=UPI0002A5F53B|nr:thioester reductase domain-containing protein [Gloeocapsa sp. PCC 7428]AFZ30068.1 thioester reductase domain protein [Gloeocapsa sp. PCC 7428]